MADPTGEAPVVNIVGQRVALGPLRRDLVPLYCRWVNDLPTLRGLGMAMRGLTLEQEYAWYDRLQTSETDRPFTVYELGSWRPIGNTGLHALDFRNRKATFGILIGEADCRGRGYGTEATRLMLDYAFVALGLNNVMLTVYSFNVPAIRAYQRAGFREIGRRRQSLLMGGCWWDEVMMDCLATEFTSPVLADLLLPTEPPDGA